MSNKDDVIFPNYMQQKRWLPIWCWHIFRLGSFATVAGFVVLCWYQPELALVLFWGIAVPVLPIVFWLMPGLWRNLCPLAATNQLPRLFRFSFEFELPQGLRRYATVIGILLLFTAIPLRKIVLNHDAFAVALLVLIAMSLAFVGGIIFKGKSGWCGSFCPLLPVQRLYAQTPAVLIPNSHCQPCVGCTRNCYDFNPKVAYLADLYDKDPVYGADRKFFAGLMPGLILAFFTLDYTPDVAWWELYLQFGFYCLVGIGSYQVLETFIKVSPHKITTIYAMISINLFYWFALPIIFSSVEQLVEITIPEWAVWSGRTVVAVLSIQWILRTFDKEKAFLSQLFASSTAKVGSNSPLTRKRSQQSNNPVVEVKPSGVQLVAEPGITLLDLLENNGEKINSGCRMGACGADPVAILDGEENLSEKGAEEQSTLERLGYFKRVRMACSASVNGNVTIDLDPAASASQQTLVPKFNVDDAVKHVVIIGNGIAGVTAADYLRRFHPTLEIDLVGSEKYPLYNRMAISKLIYTSSGMQGLMLLPEDWYTTRMIKNWLNTRAKSIDTEKKQVQLATGETLQYDKLILTAGSEANIPGIEGFGCDGCFSLRSADDAMIIRDYVQANDSRFAVVAGGGLLGLEAAYALLKIGLRVTVLERSEHLLKRQLDAAAAKILHGYLDGLGLHIQYQAEVASVAGESKIKSIQLKNGDSEKCDVLLVAAGIAPNTTIAEKAGLKTNRGVVVNAQLQASDDIYVAGDLAELADQPGAIPGLWTVAVEQGKTAALNALGDHNEFHHHPQPTALKVVGVELLSMGDFNGQETDTLIVLEDEGRYRKLVIREGIVVGAILLGYPDLKKAVIKWVNEKTNVSDTIDKLKAGEWV
ncbi:FAD-dependent oxidoreductase [Pleionea sediminis]|uniref:FAD-dependent oxidoreductase n=1 Tax=Pleionea sediminis TaxID=2569479 RepID=UPI0011867E04|nr:FAD-dependent oxidoreductase [Pleionea sediminis]